MVKCFLFGGAVRVTWALYTQKLSGLSSLVGYLDARTESALLSGQPSCVPTVVLLRTRKVPGMTEDQRTDGPQQLECTLVGDSQLTSELGGYIKE